MHLTSQIHVQQSLEQVSAFFDEPGNLAKWDRSVSKVIVTTNESIKVGFSFDTISPTGKKMSYRVIEYKRGKENKVLLTDSPIFKTAIWQMTFKSISGGTEIAMNVFLQFRTLYFFLIPVLYFNKQALFRDLDYLKKALNEHNYKTMKRTNVIGRE